jgi:hypothetical protein
MVQLAPSRERGGVYSTAIELGVCEQTNKVCTVARRNVVALKMQCDVVESGRVSIYVQGPDGGTHVVAALFGGLDLA